MTLSEIIQRVRVLLDEPSPQHPTKRHIITLLDGMLQQYHNELQITKAPWNLQTWILNVGPDVSEYLITAPDWGKPLFVMTESFQPGYAEWEIPIVNIQNADFMPGGNPLPGWGTGEHSARSIAFYGKGAVGQGRYCKLFPTPSQSAAYTVWYRPGNINPLGLTDELMLPEHHHLITHRVAMGCLPYARWADLDIETMAARRAEIGQALGYSLDMYEDSWARYRANQKAETMRRRVNWGEDGYY